jgi:hypothetical protein
LQGTQVPGTLGSSTQVLQDAKHDNYKEMHLGFGVVYTKDIYISREGSLQLQPFSVAQAAFSALSPFDVVTRMDPRPLYDFAKAISIGIPSLAKPIKTTHIRNIAIGKLINEEDPLVFELLLADETVLKGVQADSVLVLMSNVAKMTISDKTTGKARMLASEHPMNTNYNWTYITLVKNQRLATKLSSKTPKVDAASPIIDQVNATDDILKDDDVGNDKEAPLLLEPITANASEKQEGRTGAMLNLYLYLLSIGEYDEARKLLGMIKYSKESDCAVMESAGNAFREAVILYRVTRALAENDESHLTSELAL